MSDILQVACVSLIVFSWYLIFKLQMRSRVRIGNMVYIRERNLVWIMAFLTVSSIVAMAIF